MKTDGSKVMSAPPGHRTVGDVMTTRVHVASPLTPFKLLVRLIEENRISAIPIVDQHGRPVGVVSEGDLLLKERRKELDSSRDSLHPWRHMREKEKASGSIAAEIMTAPPITIPPGTLLAEAARFMQQRSVRRLIVVDDRGKIAGIVSRSDLLQVFLRSDDDIRDEVVAQIIASLAPTDAHAIDVDVSSNVITLAGEVDRRSDAAILERLSREVDGVVEVVNRLTYRWDDSKEQARAL